MSLTSVAFLRHHYGSRRHVLPSYSRLVSSLSAGQGSKVHNLKFTPHVMFQEGMKFSELNASSILVNALAKYSFTVPTEIQAKSFEAVRSGNDTIIGGETGSGKTLAYMLPLIQQCLDNGGCKEPLTYARTVILAPSKDLCRQIMTMTEGIFSELKKSGNEITIRKYSCYCFCVLFTLVQSLWATQPPTGLSQGSLLPILS